MGWPSFSSEDERGVERRLLAICRGHIATAVAFPQKSDSPPFILTPREKLQKDASWSSFACHEASLFVVGRIAIELKSLRKF